MTSKSYVMVFRESGRSSRRNTPKILAPCLSGCHPQPLAVVFGHAHGRSPAWQSSVPTIAPRVPATFSRRRGLRRLPGEGSLERRVCLPGESTNVIPHEAHAVFASARTNPAISASTVPSQAAHRKILRSSSSLRRKFAMPNIMTGAFVQCNRIFVRCHKCVGLDVQQCADSWASETEPRAIHKHPAQSLRTVPWPREQTLSCFD